jgi:pimeloyl-ACP methyl ester carboxylesterase
VTGGGERDWLRALLVVPLLAGVGYGGLLAWYYGFQERVLFQPTVLPADHRFDLGDVEELSIDVDGATLSALHLKLAEPNGVVFFLHGNGGSLASWFTNTEPYRAANYDLFMLDYRGYGKSSGRIESEAQLRADVLAAWKVVAPRYEGKRKVIYGRSLGTALAAGLAAEVQPDLTILVSPYCSMAELMHTHYSYLPTAILRYPLATCDAVPRIRGPVMLMHGELDTVIPIGQSEHLLDLAQDARLVRLPAAGHNDIHQFDEYKIELQRALKAL